MSIFTTLIREMDSDPLLSGMPLRKRDLRKWLVAADEKVNQHVKHVISRQEDSFELLDDTQYTMIDTNNIT